MLSLVHVIPVFIDIVLYVLFIPYCIYRHCAVCVVYSLLSAGGRKEDMIGTVHSSNTVMESHTDINGAVKTLCCMCCLFLAVERKT